LRSRSTAKVQYLYVDLGDTNCPRVSCLLSTNVEFKTKIVRGGVNYRFAIRSEEKT
jgi:opacity protein-like surface antigen